MNYTDAVMLVKKAYGSQADDILNNLCEESIVVIGKLYNQGVVRQISNGTLVGLSAMPPYKQAGYLANPLLQFMLEKCVTDINRNPTSSIMVEQTTKINNSNDNKNNKNDKNKKNNTVIDVPKPEPEPVIEIEDEPIIDIFG